jgi:hypothetical protein
MKNNQSIIHIIVEGNKQFCLFFLEKPVILPVLVKIPMKGIDQSAIYHINLEAGLIVQKCTKDMDHEYTNE